MGDTLASENRVSIIDQLERLLTEREPGNFVVESECGSPLPLAAALGYGRPAGRPARRASADAGAASAASLDLLHRRSALVAPLHGSQGGRNLARRCSSQVSLCRSTLLPTRQARRSRGERPRPTSPRRRSARGYSPSRGLSPCRRRSREGKYCSLPSSSFWLSGKGGVTRVSASVSPRVCPLDGMYGRGNPKSRGGVLICSWWRFRFWRFVQGSAGS